MIISWKINNIFEYHSVVNLSPDPSVVNDTKLKYSASNFPDKFFIPPVERYITANPKLISI